MKRVVQISFDIAIDKNYDTDLIVDTLINDPYMDEMLNGMVLGASFQDDVTQYYKQNEYGIYK